MEVLSDGLKHSTKELTERTNIGYPPRRIHELRKKGIKIESEPGEHWEMYWLETPACASAQVESYKVPQEAVTNENSTEFAQIRCNNKPLQTRFNLNRL